MAHENAALERLEPLDESSLIRASHAPVDEYFEGYGYDNGEDDTYSHINFSKVWNAAVRRRWMITMLVLVATSVVTVQMYRLKPTYQASTMIEVGRENTTLVKVGDVLVQNDDTIKTKTFIIQSTPILEDTVVSLALDKNPVFLRDFDMANITYAKNSFSEALRGIYNRMLFRTEVPIPTVIEATAAAEGGLSRSLAESDRLEPFVTLIAKNMSVDALTDTRLIKVSFRHTDPGIAAAVSNGLAQSFLQRSFDSKTEKFTKASDWLNRTTRELKAKVENAEQALASYTREHGIFSEQANTSLGTQKLMRLHDEAIRAETNRLVKESVYNELSHGGIANIPDTFTDPRTAELQRKLGDLATTATQLEVNYGVENPQVIEVQQQMLAVKRQIDGNSKTLEEKLRADYERSVRDEQSFKKALAQAKAEAVQENQDIIQNSVLQQEVETAKVLYKDFLQKTDQATFEVAQQYNNLRVVEPARVPKVTAGPNRQLWILGGFLLSLSASVGLALLLESHDKSIKNTADLSRYVRLPALAIIPTIDGGEHRLMFAGRKIKHKAITIASGVVGSEDGVKPNQLATLKDSSPAAEAYRLLRTSVMLSTANGSSKTILVTSSQPGEGKTTTVVNTALSLAQLGASVLVIDCDLRTPSAHTAFGIMPGPGLSAYLSGNAEIDDVIQQLPIPNVSLLPCGTVPRNPAELISSRKMKDMLELLANRYDHIMIDSPPLINLADPIILSTLVDGVILVVHGRKSARDVVCRARQDLSRVGAKIFGVVLNDVDVRMEPYYGGYYS